MDFVVVTGVSGAGKTAAMHFLEDIGFYCVDNIPPKLLPIFYNLCENSTENRNKVAVAIDIRVGDLFENLESELALLNKTEKSCKVLYLDATDEVLLRRYKETRRQHPMAISSSSSLKEIITSEKQRLVSIKAKADYIIDTSLISIAQLKQQISSLFLEDVNQSLKVRLISFGFKHGFASEADLLFDARCFANPYYDENLRSKTGLEKEVQDYVMNDNNAVIFLEKIKDMAEFLIPLYCKEGKSQLVIAIGCTGGKHRSITLIEQLHSYLLEKGICVTVSHRDINRL